MDKSKSKSPRCEKCNSTLTYIRLKDKKRICRSCGYAGKLK